MASNLVRDTSAEILGYDESLEEEIFRFEREAYPHRRPDWIAPRWRWMFLASARRLGVAPMVWVQRKGAAIVAHHGAIPVKLKAGDEEYLTIWFVETMVLESMRGQGVVARLFTKASEDWPLVLSLGQSPRMREIQLKTGWRQMAALGTYAYVLNADRVLSGKLRGAAPRYVAATGWTAMQRWRHLRGRRRISGSGHAKHTATEIDRFDERHDRLWDRVKVEYTCAVVRDASYLNWKYVEQPGQRFVRLEIRQDDAVVAAAIVQLLEPDSTYRYRRGILVDLLVRPSDASTVWALFEGVCDACRRRAVDLIVFSLIHEELARHATAFGFQARAPGRVLLLLADKAPESIRRQVLKATHWLVTAGDSDIDRPW